MYISTSISTFSSCHHSERKYLSTAAVSSHSYAETGSNANMVVVAGKSQGCNTCRKLKVKVCKTHCYFAGKVIKWEPGCSVIKEDPLVAGVTKSKWQCTGYQRLRHFKDLSALDCDTLIVRKQPLNPITEPSFIEYDHSELHLRQEARKLKIKSST